MGIIFNPLIQNTTQTNQQMDVQITCIIELFGVPQPSMHSQREGVREYQGVILEEDPTINQVQ